MLCSGGFRSFHVAVLGDFMLDRYIYGEARKISPEAPVPVLDFSEEVMAPGGAGNVVANLTGLGLSVTAVGRIGNDTFGDNLLNLQPMVIADTSYMIRNGKTTVKTRIMGSRRQQMLRIDNEEFFMPKTNDRQIVLDSLKKCIDKGIDGVIFSDYGKGFCSTELCSSVIYLCKNHGIPVFIDPKNNDWSHYQGAFLISPNIKELIAVAGSEINNEDEEIVTQGKALLEKYNVDNLLVTRSEKGATLINGRGFFHERVINKAEVFDVSGAGDTMIAVVTAFYIAGVPLVDCISVANIASQIVIEKIGTYAVNSKLLLDTIKKYKTFGNYQDDIKLNKSLVNKLISWDKAEKICDKLRKEGKKIVFTNGCFDILHSGHIDLLTRAGEIGACLIVAVNSDESVKRIKGPKRPINPCQARVKILSALECVDHIVTFEEETPEKLLSILRPDLIVKGGDYKKEDVLGSEYAKEVLIVPLTKGFSTTGIINKIGCADDRKQ